jgi:mono/diheme cytochrome c family protein
MTIREIGPRAALRGVALTLASAVVLAALALRPPPLGAQGMASGGMRDMMRRMMQGQVPPPGMTPEALPEPDSAGAHLLARYCTQCHDLPSPRYKTAEQWPEVYERMAWRMRMMSHGGMMAMHRLDAPSATEGQTLLVYLQRYGMVSATPEQLAAGPSDERAVFAAQCAQCHALPSPALHPPETWPGIVARMQANMQLMGKPQLTPSQQEAVVRFLTAAARPPGK